MLFFLIKSIYIDIIYFKYTYHILLQIWHFYRFKPLESLIILYIKTVKTVNIYLHFLIPWINPWVTWNSLRFHSHDKNLVFLLNSHNLQPIVLTMGIETLHISLTALAVFHTSLLSEFGFIRLMDNRISPIRLSLNPINPNSDFFFLWVFPMK